MKVAHLVYVLIVAIFVVIVTLLYQNSHPVDISDTYVPKEFRYKIVVKHASVSPDSADCLGRIDLPARGKRFLIYFHNSNGGDYIDYTIWAITIDDDQGRRVLYDLNQRSQDDSVNLHGYREQDNEYYKFVHAPWMLKCHVKPNHSKSPRVIRIVPDHYRTRPTYIKIVQAGEL